MGGIFGGGGGRREPTEAEKAAELAQASAEEKAQAQELAEMQAAQRRRRLRKTGGMRLLFSPIKKELTMTNMASKSGDS